MNIMSLNLHENEFIGKFLKIMNSIRILVKYNEENSSTTNKTFDIRKRTYNIDLSLLENNETFLVSFLKAPGREYT